MEQTPHGADAVSWHPQFLRNRSVGAMPIDGEPETIGHPVGGSVAVWRPRNSETALPEPRTPVGDCLHVGPDELGDLDVRFRPVERFPEGLGAELPPEFDPMLGPRLRDPTVAHARGPGDIHLRAAFAGEPPDYVGQFPSFFGVPG